MSAVANATPAAVAVPVGIHSPPDSNPALKDSGSDSELSDLDPEHESHEPQESQPEPQDVPLKVEPDHFSEGNVPVFRPTMDEFKDFQKYLNAINKWGMAHGIVKVIPPAEWLAAQPRLDEIVKTVKVKEPIKQEIMGTAGTYRQANILHGRSYNLPQWRQLCDQSDHQPPAKRGERRANQDKPTKPAEKPRSSSPAPQNSKKKRSGRPGKKSKLSTTQNADGSATPDRLPTPVSPGMKAEDDDDSVKLEPEEEVSFSRMGGRQAAISTSSRRKNNRRDTNVIDEAAFVGFKYDEDQEEFSQERCDELERIYWRTLTYAAPLYGADMPGTLFDERTTTWNLGRLENILDVLGTKIPGVNTAYLYLGMWKATFAWHLEDVDLYSINYLHFGAPKQWYSISQADARKFESAMKNIWPADAKACDQFLRHKTFLISPAHLLSHYNIRVNKVVSHPGEFVITFPYGYHSGYNLGYNCAEAVNFALESWLQYGRVAKRCDCSQAQDSVWIDVREIERKLRGEETDYESTDDEEDEDEEDDDLNNIPTPPVSSGDVKPKVSRKKRKRPTNDTSGNANAKRIRVRIKAPAKEPCILCPNDIPSEALLPTEEGKEAHRLCAQYIPETNIESGEKEVVTDVKYINKARLELKCNYCRSKSGACFQCSRKKCTRAYHATCAAAAGVFVEQGEMAVFGEDGKEYKEWGIEFSCRFHRTKRDKKLDGDALGRDKRIINAAYELKEGEVCQMQFYRGDIFAGVVVENRPDEHTLLLDILPRGDRFEVDYKWLLLPDPSDFHLQKPSATAIPMPKSFKAKESLNTSKRQVDDLPRAEDKFVDGHVWAEFKSESIPRNPFQVNVQLLSKENQIWHYLGKTSTEAKAQFTEDPKIPRHNPSGHFLDTIPRPVAALPPRPSFPVSFPASLSQGVSRIPQVQNVQNRTSQPSQASSRPEKPYVYKPRNLDPYKPANSYRIDSQAYQSQQKFLQRSTPTYDFGTDPRWQTTESSSPVVNTPSANSKWQAQGSASPSASMLSTDSRWPTTGHVSSAASSLSTQPTTAPQPTARPVNNQGPDNRSTTAAPVRHMTSSSIMAPPHTAYRHAYGPTMPAKPSNPFSSRSQSSRPNPFAKYPYLQKEHNRSPLEYKSPYRPGGGFMNGYQGNLEKHIEQLKQTMFRSGSSSTASLASLSSPLLSYNGSSSKSSYSSASPTPSTTYSPGAPGYGAYASPPAPASKGASTQYQVSNHHSAWQKQEPSAPATRQEYNSKVQPQYQAQQRPATQYQAPVMQPPSMYGRQVSPTQYQPSTQVHPTHSQPPASPSPAVTYGRPVAQPPPVSQSVNQSQYAYSPAVSQPQYNGQYTSAGPPHPYPQVYQPNQLPQHQASMPDHKPIYAHQQYFQNPRPAMFDPPQVRDPPDVPVDSTSLIEKMLKNLKKLPGTGST